MGEAQIIEVTLDEHSFIRRAPEIERERETAIRDLLKENLFDPVGEFEGPYRLRLTMEDDRLVFKIAGDDGEDQGRVPLPLRSFRKLIAEYFTVCESYFAAARSAAPAQLEALDAGRRGLHDDGSRMLRRRLEGRIEMDLDTARRLFTLLCVLHIRVW